MSRTKTQRFPSILIYSRIGKPTRTNPILKYSQVDIYQMSQVEYLAKIIDALSLATGESLAVKPGDPLIH